MKTLDDIMQHSTFRYMDHTNCTIFQNKAYTAMTSFAIDDAISTAVSNHMSPPTVRLWVHPKTVVLGIPDTRIPYLKDGVKLLQDQGYQVIVRNSGGLAVVLDEEILNISLILPNMRDISIYDCYEAMVTFVQHMLKDVTNEIQAYEIVGSYCPGDYDLSIAGKKFAGISQRRIKDAAAVQIYLDVDGGSENRARLVRDFYDIGIQQEMTKFTYPKIKPQKMASLTNLLGRKMTMENMIHRTKKALREISKEVVIEDFSLEEKKTFQKRMKMMEKRNEIIHKFL
ncbi:lipoate--protein ligase family protein [Cerasibacillus terrae]|uniref:Octanoyl-[GcvH]:protein N-octanoyltransferase n=1 Tax=Cerasibacillus terrae TaxID=2498845 RepID=A0A5C8NZU5_9BACI|nr:lipoate--protein ligase family protein [Cerasibacillus terrae]TXL66597.1 lipoate--protein ligase family protein [Cerasibacillus terrae]